MFDEIKKILYKSEYTDQDKKYLLEILDDFIKLLSKQEYTQEDKDLIASFGGDKIYKYMLQKFIFDKDIRDKLLKIGQLYYYKSTDVKIARAFSNLEII